MSAGGRGGRRIPSEATGPVPMSWAREPASLEAAGPTCLHHTSCVRGGSASAVRVMGAPLACQARMGHLDFGGGIIALSPSPTDAVSARRTGIRDEAETKP